jgi:hypothetical protein
LFIGWIHITCHANTVVYGVRQGLCAQAYICIVWGLNSLPVPVAARYMQVRVWQVGTKEPVDYVLKPNSTLFLDADDIHDVVNNGKEDLNIMVRVMSCDIISFYLSSMP